MINKEIYGSSFVELAAEEWYNVRKEIFSKDHTTIEDWNKLSTAEHQLMNYVKQSKEELND